MNPADQERQPQPTGDEQEPDYRFTLANERTFLAWIRTALALIAGGVAVVHLVPAFGIPGVRHALSLLLTAGGGLLAALAVRRCEYKPRHAEMPTCHQPGFQCCSAAPCWP
jgi:putative membrane protein